MTSTLPLYFTRHARNKMRLYGITEEQVAIILQAPDHLMNGGEQRWNAWRQMGTRWLSVTYTDEAARRVVITVTPRRRGPEAR